MLLLGIAMIVLPGPAILMIPLGIGILATEFAWARATRRRSRRSARLGAAKKLVEYPPPFDRRMIASAGHHDRLRLYEDFLA